MGATCGQRVVEKIFSADGGWVTENSLPDVD